MLNVLLVDDEPGAIKAMKYLLDWEQHGFVVAGEAANGRQAIELLEQHVYALMVTDIRMPGLFGLELIKRIRQFSQIPIIVMSGYKEFDYVKECMKYGVKDYLLKPVAEEDLSRLLMTIKSEISHETLLHKQLYHGIPAMRDQMLKRWVHGYVRDEEIEDQFRMMYMNTEGCSSVCCLVVEMDFMDTVDSFWTDSEIQIKRFAARNVMEEVIGSAGYLFEESEDRFGLVLLGDDNTDERVVIAIAEAMRDNVINYAKVSVTIGIGDIVNAYKDAVKSFYSAEKMLERKFFLGQESIIASSAFAGEFRRNDLAGVQEVQHILQAVLHGEKEECRRLLQLQMERFAAAEASKSLVRSTVLELFAGLFHLVREKGGSLEKAFDSDRSDYRIIVDSKTMQQLFDYAAQRCIEVISLLDAAKPSQPATTMETVKKIVNDDYGTNLSLKSIAEQIYMNPAYLGQLFKSNEGISFNDYLMRVRMERAKQLLRSTDKKVYEIALEVGYRELDWFYKKFKEYSGVSPSEYRAAQ
ncbi:response regulator [Paenibacillus sp. GCM10027626]|uniref:response regulator transcription factor n=1 Tax=Paenibacillus sp. GCM10027626 TaxID=3273411 RepID=UPI00363AFA1A